MTTPVVVVRHPVFPDVLEELRRHAEVIDNQSGTALAGDALATALGRAHALIVPAHEPVGAAVLDCAPHLRIVANIGVGYDNIDVAECRRRAITVTNTPGVLDESTADLAFALLLAAARRIAEADAFVRDGQWAAGGRFPMGLDVHHRTLGIVGLGRIGRCIARRAAGFAMPLVYHNRHRLAPAEEAAFGARYLGFDALLAASDFIVVQLPLTPATRHRFGAAEFARMKPSAVLINTGRGGVVDDAALAAALRTGRIAAAGLDVFEDEPRVNADLRSLPNVVLAPHVGSATLPTRLAMARRAAANVIAALAGRAPEDRIVD